MAIELVMLSNCLILTEEELKKRWQEYTEELCRKVLSDLDYHGVVAHLELDVLESEVKWASGSITTSKASRCDGLPAELLQVLWPLVNFPNMLTY